MFYIFNNHTDIVIGPSCYQVPSFNYKRLDIGISGTCIIILNIEEKCKTLSILKIFYFMFNVLLCGCINNTAMYRLSLPLYNSKYATEFTAIRCINCIERVMNCCY